MASLLHTDALRTMNEKPSEDTRVTYSVSPAILRVLLVVSRKVSFGWEEKGRVAFGAESQARAHLGRPWRTVRTMIQDKLHLLLLPLSSTERLTLRLVLVIPTFIQVD